ncbi:MAG: hypothetical protein OEO19_12320 [Gammaproteobacteria bacterium]|nr:hypothetical protein [Gammaproteobacteria bacterium]MDH3450005.1 hypothetical protein [Gammaproteobacteria bacterium]
MSSALADLTGPDRYRALWQRCLIEGATDSSADIHRRLLEGYREPQRHYHTLEHIEHCLTMFELCKPLASNPDALELALWFHDVVFEPGSHGNEARSAALYQQLSDGAHDETTRGIVGRLIMATLHDGNSLQDKDAQYMVDIDLSSFGLSWEEFLRDSENLRRENPQLGDDEYNASHSRFHNGLLRRDRIFKSDFFYRRLEKQARANIARYLALTDRQD